MEASARVHQDRELLDTEEKLMSVTVTRLRSREREFSKFTFRLKKEGKKLNFDSFMAFLNNEMEKLNSVGSARDLERCKKMLQPSTSTTSSKPSSTSSGFKVKSEKASVAVAEHSEEKGKKDKSSASHSTVSTATKVASAATSEVVRETKRRKAPPCVHCQGLHGFFRCPEVGKMTPVQILQIVVEKQLCQRCLAAAHEGGCCDKDWLKCRHCSATDHHSLTHLDEHGPRVEGEQKGKSAVTAANPPSTSTATISNASGRIGSRRNFRPIVTCEVINIETGEYIKTLAVMDTGSDRSCMVQSLKDKLGCTVETINMTVNTLNSNGVKQDK